MSAAKLSIAIDQLAVAYDSEVALQLGHLDLQGNTVALVGHNGAGKSTLIKTFLGLLKPKRGSFSLCRADIGDAALAPERHMAFCPESGSVFADISVEEYIKMWCCFKQRDSRYYRKAGSAVLDALKIAPLLSKLGRELSKGQRRRVQTAIGFLSDPALFLFDEPFDGLDVQKTDELAALIESYRSRTTFIISSHRMEVVERLADRVIVLKHGELAASGSPAQVCRELCPDGISIRGSASQDDALDLLRCSFPETVVSRHGDELRLFGERLEPRRITTALAQANLNGVELSASTPSLLEAMNYHLRRLERDKA